MLNLNRVVKYSPDQILHINSLLSRLGTTITVNGKMIKVNGRVLWDEDDKMTKSIKHRISLQTLRFQKGRCAYCETILRLGDTHIDHIVPKAKHGLFTFEPFNLVSSCGSCNSKAKKGENETIDLPESTPYHTNHFKIVHPYYTNPDDHIKFTGPDRIDFDKSQCSIEGKWTIKLFDWETLPERNNRVTISRSRDLPIPTLQDILRISTYK